MNKIYLNLFLCVFENVTILVLIAAKVDYLFYYLTILPEAPACMTRTYLNHWTMGAGVFINR